MIDNLVGGKITDIRGLEKDSEDVYISTDKGFLHLGHIQSCCEKVALNDFECDASCGDTIISAVEEVGESKGGDDEWEYNTWTFYKIETTGGEIFMRWLGTSNGYYSERVDMNWEPVYEK